MARFSRGCGELLGILWRMFTGTTEEVIEAEHQFGLRMVTARSKRMPAHGRPVRDGLLDSVGKRLVSRLTRKTWRFSFQVEEIRKLNAFALPGGFVYVTRPLLEICQSALGQEKTHPEDANRRKAEDQLAFILAHEMAHVIKGHVRERIFHRFLFGLLLSVVFVPGRGYGLLRRLAQKLHDSAYSQDQEFEADRFAVKLADAAGFTPSAAIDVLQCLEKHAAGKSPLAAHFSSHPPLASRIANIHRAMAAL